MATDFKPTQKPHGKHLVSLYTAVKVSARPTFACGAPDVYLMDLERGAVLNDPLMIQEPTTYTEVMDQIKALCTQDHPYRTLVIDSLDALETMCTAHARHTGGRRSLNPPMVKDTVHAPMNAGHHYGVRLTTLSNTKA